MKIIAGLATLFLSCGALGTPAPVQRIITQIEHEKDTLQQGAIAVLYQGKVVYQTTFGHVKGTPIPTTPDTLFPLASVSKAVAATAVAVLMEKQQIDLDKHLKIPPLRHPLSLRHILSHTTGYHFTGNGLIEQGKSFPQILASLKNLKPAGAPGTTYRYSNSLYSLVDAALKQQGQSLETAMEALRTTLKTKAISAIPLDPSAHVALPHEVEKTAEGQRQVTALPFPPYYPKTVPAAAGLFASLQGMIEVFRLAFGYRPDLLSEKTRAQLFQRIAANKDFLKWRLDWPVDPKTIESHYGLGWRIFRLKGLPDSELLFHSGHIKGVTTFIGFIPKTQVGIIVLLAEAAAVSHTLPFALWAACVKAPSE